MAEREASLDYLWDLTLLKRINFLRNLFFLIFISPFVNFFGQEIGDSIIFNTYNGKVYKGVLEKKDQDGYFFKSSYNRIIYLSKTEIKEFQKIKKEILKAESTISAINEIPTKINTEQKIVIEDLNNSSKTEYSIKQISTLIGIDDVTILLNDGRNFKGKILKIEYPNGFEKVDSKIIFFDSENKNYNFKEQEISKIYKDNKPQKNLMSENQNEFYKISKVEDISKREIKTKKGFVPLFQCAFNDVIASTIGLKYYILNSTGGFYASTSLGLLSFSRMPFLFTAGFLTVNLIEDHNDLRLYMGIGRDVNYNETQLEIGTLTFMKKIILGIGFRLNTDDPSWSTINLGFKKRIGFRKKDLFRK